MRIPSFLAAATTLSCVGILVACHSEVDLAGTDKGKLLSAEGVVDQAAWDALCKLQSAAAA